ncbi:MAG: methionine--tRNA ligase [Nitrososphaeraceae archaeon]|nr:methionine--tRNA ligase [Nitrososphaeraceae archaeon]
MNLNFINNNNSFIITGALPYANGEIHLGHISSTYLPADIFARFLRKLGKKVYFICASDDYGTPILIKAEKENKTPEQFVQYWNSRDREDFASISISFDKFYKTSSKENVEFVQDFFLKLKDNGYIYEKDVIQFFCDYDNKFLPDRYVLGTCPYCNSDNQYSDLCEKCGRVPQEILDPKCGICGKPPTKKSSKHYFFKLSSFSEKLRTWLSENENLQTDIKRYVINWIDEGLDDWDITRDISWGIPVPLDNAHGKVFYGWFDNHLCYISTTMTILADENNVDGKKFWNDSQIYHFIGKDIVYHHFLFLPAMRMGVDNEYKLPDFIPCRGHLMLQNQKISKSRNWYIGLRDFISQYDQDYLRFYLASISSYSQDDINFDWDLFYEKINNELIDNVGNFINRVLSYTKKQYNGIVPQPITEFDSDDKICLEKISTIENEVAKFISSIEVDKALKEILKFSNYFNQYFQTKSPWKNKEGTANTTVYLSLNAVRELTLVLEPFIPNSCSKIWLQLGYSETETEKIKTNENVIDKEDNNNKDSMEKLKIRPGHILGEVSPLFKKIEKSDIEKQKLKLQNNLSVKT